MQGIEMFKFHEGEKTCEICGEALPALNFTQARKAFVCSRWECQKDYYGHSRQWRWIGEHERECQTPCTASTNGAGGAYIALFAMYAAFLSQHE